MSKKKRRKKPNIPEVTLRRYGPGADRDSTARVERDKDFSPDYSHIIKDLKRIAVLAVSLIGLLFVLSFVLG